MALITTAAREELVALFIGMFRAAPGATNLSQMVAAYESGATTAQIAANLATRADFQTVYPTLQTAEEFAAALVATLLDGGVPAAAQAWATNWVVTNLQAGKSRPQVITEAVQAIRATANTNYTTAQAQLANKVEVATYYSVTKLQSSTSLLSLQDIVDGVTADVATVATAKVEVDDLAANASGQTFTLTTGVDTVNGTIGNDIINATDTTATGLDTISGNAGKDTVNFNDVAGGKDPAGLIMTGIETVNVRSAGAATVTGTTNWSGVETLNVSQGTSATVTANGATALNVSGITGAINATAGTGAMTAAGTQGASTVDLNGGSSVSATLSGVSTGTVKVGQTTQATGAVTVSSTGAAVVAGTDVTLGAITIDGGTTITVNQTATSDSAATATDTTGATITQSAVDIGGGATTTAVTVTQTAPAAEKAYVAADAGTKEVAVVTFSALKANEDTTINGLTFTAAKDLTAAQVAAAFANLSASTTQGSASAANGVYKGTFTADYSTGAVTTSGTDSQVTFTAALAGNATDVDVDDGTIDMVIATKTDGTASTKAVTGVLGVVGGKVTVDQGTSTKLATVTLAGYGAGSTIVSNALATLNLASSNSDLAITNATATTLALGLNAVGTSTSKATLTAPTYTTVNIATSGANSVVDMTAAAAKVLSISGDKSVTLTGATLGVLESVTISGSAGATFDIDEADTITAFSASGTSGAVTAFIDPTKATYTGSSGADTLTLTAAAPTKNVSLNAGDDSLTLATGTTTSTSTLSGGDGTDTLTMAAADAVTASATETFEGKFDGFEKLGLGTVSADGTVNLANMDDISYVIVAAIDAGKTQTFTKMANGGTVERTGAGADAASKVVVTLSDATGTADTLNVVTKVGAADLDFRSIDAAGVESINITATDTVTTTIQTATLNLIDAALTTVTITGNSHLVLTLDANVKALTSVNGGAMTGKLTAGTNGTVSQTITGGSGADTLTANGSGDTLNGGAGNDTLTVGAAGNLTTMTGGAGADIFNVAAPTTNVNSYATITDLAAGDKIQFAAADSFAAAAINLGDTAVFQDFANFAINNTDTGAVSWFQFGGNTYVIENASDGTSFLNGTDIIVRINGLVDLSSASLSESAFTLLIV